MEFVIADILRLLVVPVFAYAAWTDQRTRRVKNSVWTVVAAIGVLALTVDLWTILSSPGSQLAPFAIRTGVSVVLMTALGFGFWMFGAFGGADAKAMMALSVAYPVFPTYQLLGTVFPTHTTPFGVFSFTILTNTVLVVMLYPVSLFVRNLVAGNHTLSLMPVAMSVPVDEILDVHGQLLEDSRGRVRGADVDVLRMYLRWRDTTLDELRNHPERFRYSVPWEPDKISDGRVMADGGIQDEWGVDRFMEDVDTTYGSSAADIRCALTHLSEADRVWVSPGIPFIVPMFIGLLVSIIVGDVLYGLLDVFWIVV